MREARDTVPHATPHLRAARTRAVATCAHAQRRDSRLSDLGARPMRESNAPQTRTSTHGAAPHTHRLSNELLTHSRAAHSSFSPASRSSKRWTPCGDNARAAATARSLVRAPARLPSSGTARRPRAARARGRLRSRCRRCASSPPCARSRPAGWPPRGAPRSSGGRGRGGPSAASRAPR